RVAPVPLVERAAGDQRNAHALEEARCDDIEPRDRLLFLWEWTLRDIDVRGVPIVEHWKRQSASCGRHARQRSHSIQQLRDETALAVGSIAGFRNVEMGREEVPGIEAEIG